MEKVTVAQFVEEKIMPPKVHQEQMKVASIIGVKGKFETRSKSAIPELKTQ